MKKVSSYWISKVSKPRLKNLCILFLVLSILSISGNTFVTTAANYKYADVNGDGSIDALDSAVFKMYLLNITSTFPVADGDKIADLDGDGSVNAIDFSLLKQYLLGVIIKFPVESTSDVKIPWDWAGVIGTGQSLSVGAQASPAVTTSQPYHNLKLSLGNMNVPPYDYSNSALKMAPLVEPIRSYANGYPSPYPKNIYGETPHTTMGNQITSLVKAISGLDYITAHTVVGESGQGMVAIRKGATDTGSIGRAYAASIFEVNAIKRLATAAGKTYGVGAIILTHGETDSGSSTYKSEMYKLWLDYNQDIKVITGQTQKIPLFVSQQHAYPSNSGTSIGTLAQWQVGIDYPGDIICTGPKYQYPCYSDGVHLVANGYQQLGEKNGEIYYEKVVLGRDWQPLQPTTVTRSGRVITVNLHVPVGPLTWDSTMPAPNQSTLTEWKNGKGFEVSTSSGRVTISSVAISGNSVVITCASDLPSSGVKVGYAFTTGGTKMTNGTFRWGLLKDSDPFKGSTTGILQPNYCVAFEVAVP
jgi:hypothetical protein